MLTSQMEVKEKLHFWPLDWKPRNGKSGDGDGRDESPCVSSDYWTMLAALPVKTLWHQNSEVALPETDIHLSLWSLPGACAQSAFDP